MIKNVKLSKRLLSMLTGAIIGVTPVLANAESENTTGFTLVKQEMKIEGNDLNIDRYAKKIENAYYYLKQFIDYETLQADLQILYYIANRGYISTESNDELVENKIVYSQDYIKENFNGAFRLIDKINEYNQNTIKNDYENKTMDINHLIDVSKLCFDIHDQEIVASMFKNYFNAYQNNCFDNEEYTSVFKELTTLNAYERENNAHSLMTGAMWLSQITIGREVIQMLHDDMLRDYSKEELLKYYNEEEFNNVIWKLKDDVSLDLNCLNELEYEIFNLGELETFCYNQVNNNIYKIFSFVDTHEEQTVIENNNEEYSNPNSFNEGVSNAYNYLSNKISYDHLQTDLQCLYYLTNRTYLTNEEDELINNGIVYQTNFETEEGLQNFMQAYSLINMVLDYNQSVIRNDYEQSTMDINHLIDPSVICMDATDKQIVHELHVEYFEAYKNNCFENQNYYNVVKELVNNENLSIGAMWLSRNIIGGDVMQMLRDDMQADYTRDDLNKFFVSNELNKGQWLVREDINLNSNTNNELELEVYNFKSLWQYVYDDVNNDLFTSFMVDCNTK